MSPTSSNTDNVAEISVTAEEKDIEVGTRVLQQEAEGLTRLALGLDRRFALAVDTIERMKAKRRGRLIVTGMGKSGHVANKIAATMASCGTPSYFVHPAEASHGDLGMVTEDDVVLALSNSGDAPELGDIIAYTRRFGIPLIAITSRMESLLGKAADITLELPNVGEACPNGLAPTTSTTLTMALGDALAIALLERMGLTAEEFKVFHPGGKLGKRLLRVSELMIPLSDLPTVPKGTLMQEALLIMSEKNIGSVLITEGAELLGIITDGDLKRHMDGALLQKSVESIMSTDPKSIVQDVLAAKALDVMLNGFAQPITSLIVYERENSRTLAGMIRLQSCLQAGLA